MGKQTYRLGIDIGGTFTDLTLLNVNTGLLKTLKMPTVPEDPAAGIQKGLDMLEDDGINVSSITYFVHGTTIGLNTLLQRKGAKTALFVTEGFRDILSLQRLRLPVPYDFRSRLPEPLVPRKHVYSISERMLHTGDVHQPLEIASIDQAIDQALEENIEGIVVAFLHSYRNSTHEEKAVERIRERAPHIEVIGSAALWPQMREFERAVLGAANVYIQPKVRAYFTTLKERLESRGVRTTPFITQSNGGIMTIETAAEAPVRTLFSGPAAGVVGALQEAKASGLKDIVTFDMGGTSADISIIENGHPTFTQANQLGGVPIMMPSVSMYSVGAGGGSKGWIDAGGMLKVGPESVGSDPGPACYGKGKEPSLTDAFLLCGYLSPDRFAAGNLTLHPHLAEQAMMPIASHLGSTPAKAADHMIQVAVANMYAELSNVMEQHGFDPRSFSFLAFGGAGPVTANFLAEEIQARRVVVPPTPGTLCAQGALSSDFVYDAVKSVDALLHELPMDSLRKTYESLSDEAASWLDDQNLEVLTGRSFILSLDARYKGQAFDIEMDIENQWVEAKDSSSLIDRFHALHKKQYGHSDPEAIIEIINLRARIIGHTPKPLRAAISSVEKGATLQPIATRQIICRGQAEEASVYRREDLLVGHVVPGPAIVEQDDTTTVVLPAWEARTDVSGNLLIERQQGGERS
ncbi:hydantoinase/oxoprolinase family protein [Aureibacillus halotolerans]|uniref:N-methylhydantoinase A n=1 Tax=Aureibacillus halotolerans TaxID=1508390 RepID=A0A4R6U8N7_9BACI|nr:hydantoinase/oxoprolinase family protein [Aureibacillus halotolerans]TDQ42928.1 N-methylhydantoinase A [Aureibacillus halotolerans]